MQNSTIVENYINYIDSIIKNNRISHAYLIELSDYDNDIKYVFDFIKMILCNVSYSELSNCNNSIISLIDSNNYPDLYVIGSDTDIINKSLIIDLQKEFSNKSLLGGKRIYIIKQAEKLNTVRKGDGLIANCIGRGLSLGTYSADKCSVKQIYKRQQKRK